MSKKVRDYNKGSIEVCRNCKGCGMIQSLPEFHPHGKEFIPTPVQCPICAGSGRVTKKVHIEITITPYPDSPGE